MLYVTLTTIPYIALAIYYASDAPPSLVLWLIGITLVRAALSRIRQRWIERSILRYSRQDVTGNDLADLQHTPARDQAMTGSRVHR